MDKESPGRRVFLYGMTIVSTLTALVLLGSMKMAAKISYFEGGGGMPNGTDYYLLAFGLPLGVFLVGIKVLALALLLLRRRARGKELQGVSLPS